MNLPSFDAMSALFHSDPAAFERFRTELIESEISKASPERQRRLRGLQFRIDAIRRTSKTPLASCVLIQQMLHDKAFELLTILKEDHRPCPRTRYHDNILPFERRRHRALTSDSMSPPAD